jgi:hypothetical protein
LCESELSSIGVTKRKPAERKREREREGERGRERESARAGERDRGKAVQAALLSNILLQFVARYVYQTTITSNRKLLPSAGPRQRAN